MKVELKNIESFYRILHPRLVVLIGSGKFGKDANFMACSWNTPIAEDIPSCGIAIAKDSYTCELITKYKEFSINVLPLEKKDAILFVGRVSGREVNKIEKGNLKVTKGKKTDLPILEDSIAFLECKLINFLDVAEVRFFIGQVIHAEYEKELFDENTGYNIKKVNLPYHLRGNFFATVK